MTRRRVLRGVTGLAGVLSVGSLSGCTGGGGGTPDHEVYVVAFHWGFRMLRPDGSVVDSLDATTGDTVAIHGVSLEPIADGEELDVPDAVYSAAADSYHTWEGQSLERIAPLVGTTVEDLEGELETAEEQYKDHGMAMRGPNGDTIAEATLSGDMSAPVTKTVTVDAAGNYDITCTTYCGVGHAYMQLADAIQVS